MKSRENSDSVHVFDDKLTKVSIITVVTIQDIDESGGFFSDAQ